MPPLNDTREWLEAFSRFEESGLRSALATVIRVEGSSYRRPGAQMIISEAGEVAGCVSGGCLERDLIRRAVRLLRVGDPTRKERVTYDTRLDREGQFQDLPEDSRGLVQTSLGCEGIIEIELDSNPAARVQEARDLWAKQGVQLIVFGAGHDAIPLTRLAREVGWDTTVVDCHAAFPQPRARFAHVGRYLLAPVEAAVERAQVCERSVVVVMTHHQEKDRQLLEALLSRSSRYLGLLGPRKRGVQVVTQASLAAGISPEQAFERVRFPVGLDIGGEGPTAIALSVISEIQAVLSGRSAGFLKDRMGPIHDRSAPLKGDLWNSKSMERN